MLPQNVSRVKERDLRDNRSMAIHGSVLHNGHIRNASDALLSPGQVGLLSGWGVFSTLRVAEGVLFAWERHWARMERDAELMYIPMPDDPERVRLDLLELIETNQAFDSTLRLVVVRNTGGMWHGPSTGHASDVVALTADTNQWGDGVRLMYQPEGRHSKSDFSRAKILSWSQNLCWHERAHLAGFDECILLNELGEVTECTSANLFIVSGSQVWTAPLSSGCLPGVTRELLLSEIHVPGIQVAEKALVPRDLETADEVFITSTTRDLLPVFEIEGRKLTATGSVRARLLDQFHQYLADYVSSHRELARSSALSRAVR